jgi:hypothetical protein
LLRCCPVPCRHQQQEFAGRMHRADARNHRSFSSEEWTGVKPHPRPSFWFFESEINGGAIDCFRVVQQFAKTEEYSSRRSVPSLEYCSSIFARGGKNELIFRKTTLVTLALPPARSTESEQAERNGL